VTLDEIQMALVLVSALTATAAGSQNERRTVLWVWVPTAHIESKVAYQMLVATLDENAMASPLMTTDYC
jgi:hypothetical protein